MTDWDSLRYVLAIAREGGLSGAARALGVNHATVSRQLARAEAGAGTPLFTRLATGLEPTEAGQIAVARAATVEAEMLALDLALAGRDERAAGRLTITAPPLIVGAGLAGDIAAFHAAFPAIELVLLGGDQPLNLHRREADVAIRVSRQPGDTLWGRKIANQSAGWFATPAFIAQHRAALAAGGAVPIVAFTGWDVPIPAELGAAEVVVTADDMVSAMALVRTGLAMARMPLLIGQGDPQLALVPGLPLIDYWPIWALTHPDLRRVPRVVEFIRFVAKRFASRAERYTGAGD